MKLLMENWNKFVNEQEVPPEQQQQQQAQQPPAPEQQQQAQPQGGSWPSKPPKTVKITAGSNLSPQAIQATWQKLASMNPPKDPEQTLASIGGMKALIKNVKGLEANFAGSGDNPPRIDMPVVDPAKDFKDLEGRLAKGELDLKEPFANWQQVQSQAVTKQGMRGKRKPGMGRMRMKEQQELREKIVKLLKEVKYDMPDKFPTGLDQASDTIQQAFLTKGKMDKDPQDDSAVKLGQVPIDVNVSFPTQSEVYLDKSMWNILNFGPTSPGGTAHGKPNLIAIQSPDGKNFILDGHHRWSSAYISGGPSAKINVQALQGLDVPTAIAALRAYGNARDNTQKG